MIWTLFTTSKHVSFAEPGVVDSVIHLSSLASATSG